MESGSESNKKKFQKSKINKAIKRSDSYDSVNYNFQALDEYKKEADEFPLNENIFSIDNNLIELKDIEEEIHENHSKEKFKRKKDEKIKADSIKRIKMKMNLKDKLVLSDIEKYQKFGKFPYILLIHIFIVILSTLIVINFKNKY